MTQKETILKLLQQAGSKGVNSWDLTYKFHIKQAPTRIQELEEQGYIIKTRKCSNGSVDYFLVTSSARLTAKVVKPVYVWVYEGNTAKQVLAHELGHKQEELL